MLGVLQNILFPKIVITSMLKYSHHQLLQPLPQRSLRREKQNITARGVAKNVSLCSGLTDLQLPPIDTSEGQKLSLGSLHEYLNQVSSFKKHKGKMSKGDKLSALKLKKRKLAEEALRKQKTAEQILTADWAGQEQKKLACREIAQTSFQKIYGDSLTKQGQRLKQKRKNISNMLNLHSLEETISQMQFNPRSHSIMLRKQQLQMLRNDYFMSLNTSIAQQSEQDIIQTIYRLKNAYLSLKNTIIPSKNEEFDELKQKYGRKPEYNPKDTANTDIFFKTALMEGSTQEDEQLFTHFLQKFKCFKNSSMIKNFTSKFYISKEEIILQNIKQMRAPTFLCLMSRINFQQLRILQLKYLKIGDQLVFLLLDCLKELGDTSKSLKSLEISAITIENRKKFGEKLGLSLKQLRLKTLKVQAMEIGTSQFQRIAQGIPFLKQIEQISFQNNRIDILGVRVMQGVCKKLPRLKSFDARNNQIPHYANLSDKHSAILFF